MHSRQVNWFEVYQFVERWVSRRSWSDDDLLDHNLLPGTPQWCGLPDDDARKLLALMLGGVREALNHDVVQGHRAEASRAVASVPDWRTRPRGAAYIPRRKEIA